MNRKMLEEKLNELFHEDEELFVEAIEALDAWNGCLADDRYYFMEDLDQYVDTKDLWNTLIYRMYYGHDEDNYTIDNAGNKHYEEFNPSRKYFYYNGYGNLVSTDTRDYSYRLDGDFIDDFIYEYEHLYITDNRIIELMEEWKGGGDGGEKNS